MSFSSDVKKELSNVKPEKSCCARSELGGLYASMASLNLLGRGQVNVQFSSESLAVCRRAYTLLSQALHIAAQIHYVSSARFGGKRKCVLTLGPIQSPVLLCALGMPIYCILDNIPMIEMPKFIGCLFAGAIARNVMEAAGIKFYVPEVDAIEHMFLELYLALVLMTTDFTKLAPVAGQMSIILIAQGIFMALFGIFVSFNLFGRDYGAAVMTAGNIGWGCGSGSNAVANEKALMDQYGWHNIAWVLYPSFAVIIDDIYNPIFLSLFGGLFKG